MKKDIENIDDIRLLVDSFYGTVREDDLIGPIFLGKITDWPVHLEKMYRFWQTILLEEYTYNGAPFPPHARTHTSPYKVKPRGFVLNLEDRVLYPFVGSLSVKIIDDI
jgi:truncated hemoglobin YjbI